MKQWFLASIVLALLMTACEMPKTVALSLTEPENAATDTGSQSVTLTRLSESVWIHTTYGLYHGSSIPANGLVILADEGAVLVDIPWDNGLTVSLMKEVEAQFGMDVILAVVTHAHVDRMGGIDALLGNGTKVISTSETARAAEENGFTPPIPELEGDELLEIGGRTLEVFSPGPGHTVDNITVFLPDEGILFAGCLAKSADAQTVQVPSDVGASAWVAAIERVREKFPEACCVVPGHGAFGGPKLLTHTIELLSK